MPRIDSHPSSRRAKVTAEPRRGKRSGASVALINTPSQTAEGRRRIGILDSDKGFLLVLGNRLEGAGWEQRLLPVRATSEEVCAMGLDALVVDAALLGAGRLGWLERVCRGHEALRVLVCTADSSVAERVRALRFGVDAWLGKPCHPEELIARIEAVTFNRSCSPRRDLTPAVVGEVEIRPDQYQAFVAGESLRLTRREYQLIDLLRGASGEVIARELIYERLWGYEMARNDRSVDVFVHKLRRKLEAASPRWDYIHTHSGVGYRLAAVHASEAQAALSLSAAA
jgi:DNA-binding response OmpR family regulator